MTVEDRWRLRATSSVSSARTPSLNRVQGPIGEQDAL
jgi:hypothetical protein